MFRCHAARIIDAMRTSMLRGLVASLLTTASIGVVAVATAAPKTKDATEAKPAASAAASAKPGITPYDQQIIDANKAFSAGLAGNAFDDAMVAYRKAIALDPARPEGHLYLGAALYQKGDYAAAIEALGDAANRGKADKAYANLQGKALFLLATVKEASLQESDAKTAWQDYEAFAKQNPDQELPKGSGDAPPMMTKVYQGSAVEREAKIEGFMKLTDDYAKVRALIAARQKELGIPTPDASAKKP